MSIRQRVGKLEASQAAQDGRREFRIRVSLVDDIDPALPDFERRPDGKIIIRVRPKDE